MHGYVAPRKGKGQRALVFRWCDCLCHHLHHDRPQISGLTHFFWGVLRNFRTEHVAEPHFCLSLSGARVCFVCACGPHLPLAYSSRKCKHVLPMLGQPIFLVSSPGPFLWSKYLVRQISSSRNLSCPSSCPLVSRSDGACQKCFPNPLFCPLPE